MNRLDPSAACPAFLEVFTDFVDGTLPRDRESEIRAHLDCCEGCLRHLAAYRRGVMALKACERDVDPATFWDGLERRLWTEGHLAGGHDGERPSGPGGLHPAWAVAAAACFAVVVFFAGVWGDRVLDDARDRVGDRAVITTASIGSTAPVVVESEPIEIPESVTASRRPSRPVTRPSSTAAEAPARIVRARLDTPVAPAPDGTVEESVSVDQVAEAAYVASLERELAAWEAIERTRSRAAREGLRRALESSRVAADGWVTPVRIGAAGVRTLRANAPVEPWPVEAAASLP